MIGLVHYPTTRAPVSGSVTVTTQCADNAHIIDTASHNVTCESDGSWSGQIPQCECDFKYNEVIVNGRHICHGEITQLICIQSSKIYFNSSYTCSVQDNQPRSSSLSYNIGSSQWISDC